MNTMNNERDNVAWVIKTSGDREQFSVSKLRRSLLRSGAEPETIERIITHIIPEVHDGMRTSQIYKHAYSILKKNKYAVAVRYSLRKAVMELGPSGFPFEEFVSEIFRRRGFTTKTGVVLPGFCVLHEVDVLMEKDERHIFAECKFHNQQGIKTDVKVALYVNARFQDLQKGHEIKEVITPKIHEGWLITNTKLTMDAIQYANCAGLTVISWDYPEKGNLQDLILETGVHPITVLNTLSMGGKNVLLEKGVVLCDDLKKNPEHLKSLQLGDDEVKNIISEIDSVCRESHPA